MPRTILGGEGVVRRIFPKTFYNPLSLMGAMVALLNLGLIVFLVILELVTKHPKPYTDVIIFIILPTIVFCGLVLAAIGIVRERRRQKAGELPEERLPIINLNDPKHRTMVAVLGGGFVVLSLFYAFASYQAYEYTESDTFCGQLCHSVMGPESTAHAFSPHAEIQCVACHVGSGARYFFLSKLDGSHQLYALVFNKYHRPIPTPISNLRPSQDTCQTCHAPKQRVTDRIVWRPHFLSDAKNTEWIISLLLKMGSGSTETTAPPNLHWHYTVAKEINYVAADAKRTVIPWIKVTSLDGKERIYRSTGSKMTDSELESAEKRVMDCIDCHNRIGHFFRPPAPVLNMYMQVKRIDPSLQEIKKIAVQALEGTYASKEAGRDGIRKMIMDFYQSTYPEVASSRKADIEKAIAEIQDIYRRNYDPVMKVSWKDFADNAGHMYSVGCFRCHDGNHVSDDGRVLSKDCSTCHLLISPAVDRAKGRAVFTLAKYPHPVDIGDAYKEMNCSACHGGTT